MNTSLILKACLGLVATPIGFGLPLFLAAGSIHYWEGWVFLLVFSIATGLHGIDLMINDPEVLKRRMRAGPTFEKRPAQRIIMVIVITAFVFLPVVSGLDHRYHWSHVPTWLVIVGDFLIVFAYLIFYIVLKQNRFAAATIQVAEGQKLASTGLYGIVRHPMYAGSILLMLGIPLSLGSYWAILIGMVIFPALHWRIIDEEKCLVDDLEGYDEYLKRVKYRLIPGVY